MKKVLIYAPNAPTSGVTSTVFNLHKNMNKNSVCLSIISWPENEKMKLLADQFQGTFYPFKIYFLRHPFLYRKELKKILSSDKFDVTVFNMSYLLTLYPFMYTSKNNIENIIAYSHSSNIEAVTFFRRKLLYTIHFINKWRLRHFHIQRVACSLNAWNWLYGKGYKPLLINNAIDINAYLYNASLRSEQREVYHVSNQYVVGNIGRLTYPKNQLFLIEIFYLYLQVNPNAVLWIVGEGPLRLQLLNAIKRYHLNGKVVLWGNRQDIPKLLQCMDLYIMPSHFEGAPVSLIEAQANGLPCIISDSISEECIINKNVIKKSLNCPPTNWCHTMEELQCLERLPDVANKLKEKGWDLNNVCQQLQKIYTD